MVKKKKTSRQKVREKAAKKTVSAIKGDGAAATPLKTEEESRDPIIEERSGRVKRKVEKQLRFLSKLQETQRILGTNKVISKKKIRHGRKRSGKTLNNLFCLSEALPSIDKKISAWGLSSPYKSRSCKARQHLLVKETEQLGMVLAHPEFKANPFSAIQQHLENTLGVHISDTKKQVDTASKKKKLNVKSNKGFGKMDIS